MSLVAILRVIAIYLLAVLVATILGGLVQAQVELATLAEAPVSFSERLAANQEATEFRSGSWLSNRNALGWNRLRAQ